VVETGHRSVAFIMIDPNTPAMESRFDGVERAVTAAGASLHRVVPRAGVNRAGLRGPLWDKAWPPIRNLFTSGSLRRALPVHVASVFERACNRALFSSLDAYATEVLLRPVLTQAMRELDATVWIAENDPTAVACLRFLRERNVAVPGEVALVGFDDSPEAAGNDLTSYNFNAPAIARAMLQFVLHPGQARRPHSPVDIDGFVVERGSAPRSSGPAAGDSVSARAPARATRRSRRRR
jgi:DNA-binding LacI/PurR family transcriptional regulator